jgi:hypothetical protein
MPYLAQHLTLQLVFCPSPEGEYLRWLTPLGEWAAWLFAGDVDTKTDSTDATDSATADGRATVAVRRPATDTLTVTSNMQRLPRCSIRRRSSVNWLMVGDNRCSWCRAPASRAPQPMAATSWS